MQTSTSTPELDSANISHLTAANMNSLVVELEHYRRQSEWLALVNGLHGRLAGAVDLPSMLEAFSVWLMPLVQHDLMAYKNIERERLHMFCSCHGPQRQHVMKIASDVFSQESSMQVDQCHQDDHYVENFPLDEIGGSGILLVLRKDREIGAYEKSLLVKGLKILVEPLQRAIEYEDLYEQASRDSLTGLVNRRVFEERINSVMAQAARNGNPVTLACMDLDKFKQVNDVYGHAVGDMVLQKVAHTMERMVRSCDILARMGGDEFMLIMPDTSLEAAYVLAERLCCSVKELALDPVEAHALGISIGLVELDKGMPKKVWLQKTDETLYKAKAHGRSQVAIYGEHQFW